MPLPQLSRAHVVNRFDLRFDAFVDEPESESAGVLIGFFGGRILMKAVLQSFRLSSGEGND